MPSSGSSVRRRFSNSSWVGLRLFCRTMGAPSLRMMMLLGPWLDAAALPISSRDTTGTDYTVMGNIIGGLKPSH